MSGIRRVVVATRVLHSMSSENIYRPDHSRSRSALLQDRHPLPVQREYRASDRQEVGKNRAVERIGRVLRAGGRAGPLACQKRSNDGTPSLPQPLSPHTFPGSSSPHLRSLTMKRHHHPPTSAVRHYRRDRLGHRRPNPVPAPRRLHRRPHLCPASVGSRLAHPTKMGVQDGDRKGLPRRTTNGSSTGPPSCASPEVRVDDGHRF